MSEIAYERATIIAAQRTVLWSEVKGKLDAILNLSGIGHEYNLYYEEKMKHRDKIKRMIDDFTSRFEEESNIF